VVQSAPHIILSGVPFLAKFKTDCKRKRMDLNSDQKELVELFVKQELLIGTLYNLFAKRYPAYKDFWTEISIEEYHHASLIQRITESDSLNNIKFSQGELRTSSLASGIKFIEGLISDFKNNKDFPITQAVITALQLEKALWERKVFQCFKGDSDEVKRIMDSLNLEQEIHIKKIDKFASQFQNKKS
jgi:hypothetical protein